MVYRVSHMNAIHQRFSCSRLVAAILVAFIAAVALYALYGEYFGVIIPNQS